MAPKAQVTPDFRPAGRYGRDVSVAIQRALGVHGTSDWEGQELVDSFDMPQEYPDIIVEARGACRHWGVYRWHTASRPGLSPFVSRSAPMTSVLSIHLVEQPAGPMLVRAYPGEYMPSLPWQMSARSEEGGVAACRAFWRQYAFVETSGLIVPGTATRSAPDWF